LNTPGSAAARGLEVTSPGGRSGRIFPEWRPQRALAGARCAGRIETLRDRSLLSIVQMPAAFRSRRWRSAKAGAINAALLPAAILAESIRNLRALKRSRNQTQTVLDNPVQEHVAH